MKKSVLLLLMSCPTLSIMGAQADLPTKLSVTLQGHFTLTMLVETQGRLPKSASKAKIRLKREQDFIGFGTEKIKGCKGLDFGSGTVFFKVPGSETFVSLATYIKCLSNPDPTLGNSISTITDLFFQGDRTHGMFSNVTCGAAVELVNLEKNCSHLLLISEWEILNLQPESNLS